MRWLLLVATLFLMAQAPAPRLSPINAPSATGVAATDTAALQGALNAAKAQGGGIVLIPNNGVAYSTNTTLLVASNTSVQCAPGATIKPVATASFTGGLAIANLNNAATTLTDHDIVVQDCTVDASNWPGEAGHHAFVFQFVNHVRVIKPKCPSGPGDCTAMVGSQDTWVENGYASECVRPSKVFSPPCPA